MLYEIEGQHELNYPTPSKRGPNARPRDTSRYCHFHREYGHNTDDCRHLKNAIEDLIHRGHLDRFIRREAEEPQRRPTLERVQPVAHQAQLEEPHMNIIH